MFALLFVSCKKEETLAPQIDPDVYIGTFLQCSPKSTSSVKVTESITFTDSTIQQRRIFNFFLEGRLDTFTLPVYSYTLSKSDSGLYLYTNNNYAKYVKVPGGFTFLEITYCK